MLGGMLTSLRQARPSRASSSSACFRSPRAGRIKIKFRRVFLRRQASSIGSMNAHASSTSSRRAKRVASPLIASSSKRSYASGTRFAERSSVMKIHFHRFDPETCSRHFRLHAQRNSFVGLDPNHEDVLVYVGRSLLNRTIGAFLKCTEISVAGFRQSFADAHVNRHVRTSASCRCSNAARRTFRLSISGSTFSSAR